MTITPRRRFKLPLNPVTRLLGIASPTQPNRTMIHAHSRWWQHLRGSCQPLPQLPLRTPPTPSNWEMDSDGTSPIEPLLPQSQLPYPAPTEKSLIFPSKPSQEMTPTFPLIGFHSKQPFFAISPSLVLRSHFLQRSQVNLLQSFFNARIAASLKIISTRPI